MNYIAASITAGYWPRKTSNWLDSVLANKPEGWEVILFCIDFVPDIQRDGLHVVIVREADVATYTPGWCDDRAYYVCLEGGEFIDLFDFQDTDLVIFSNVDITLQREFTAEELEWIHGLPEDQMAMQYDAFPPRPIYDPDYITSPEVWAICNEGNDSMVIHNCGVLVGRIGAWKRLYADFKGLYNAVKVFPPQHHAISQWVINYVLQVNDALTRLPNGFHEAHWWDNSEVHFQDGQYCLDGSPVLFAHHKYARTPHYITEDR